MPKKKSKIGASRQGNHYIFPWLSAPDGFGVGHSSLELDHCIVSLCDPRIKKLTLQVEVSAEIDGKVRKTILDSTREFHDGRLTADEVKYEAQVADGHTQDQVMIGRLWANKEGREHHLLTEQALRLGSELYLKNCHQIYMWSVMSPDPEIDRVSDSVAGFVASRGETTIELLSQELKLPADLVLSAAVRLYLKGRVCFMNIRVQAIGRKSVVNYAK